MNVIACKETMHGVEEFAGKKKKKIALQPDSLGLSCEEKKKLADEEDEALQKQIHALQTWTDKIDAMDDQQLKEYLQNRPAELKTVKIRSTKPRKKVQRVRKCKPSTSNGIMAAVWKFHKPDNEDSSANSDAHKM